MSTVTINGNVSFWWTQLGLPTRRQKLPGSRTADVCIVGGGYTGLWTAYYLKKRMPSLDVVILESEFAGFGASGRNGGWLTNSITGGRRQYLSTSTHGEVERMQKLMNEAVDEVIRVAGEHNIQADIHKGGELSIATTPAQLRRLSALATAERLWRESGLVELSADETQERIRIPSALGGTWHPHCARIHPAKLVRGLAQTVESLGVTIYESTTVSEIRPHQARTDAGTVTAEIVIRATEGFTANLRHEHRTWLPMNSSLIVTEPLTDSQWNSIGWEGRETLGNFAHVYMYAQRTFDNRIAFGGRGNPYRFGSRTDKDGATQVKTIASLREALVTFFPAAEEVPIAHAWSGVLGVPRDWAATMGLNRATGLGWAGGYVGTGVTTTNMAGRTLADLVLQRETEHTRLPWVGHMSRKWECEPLRWLAVQGIYRAYNQADKREQGGRAETSILAKIADVVAGRH
ncbi:MAG: FAD-dependent oxidoreductase [Candidatus Lumbricidophila eiseniae]|uniref:FAD-dependent oxidoreductase n=1 Tax=Candidatus Lumbricidiphila eiseniae TaxID=1969409 RepID=A0A2A6FPR7_9MICO|nr:MAG: FAD-dependent oxidoreductase [Candidatus Lumbricidophila eiseniae]